MKQVLNGFIKKILHPEIKEVNDNRLRSIEWCDNNGGFSNLEKQFSML